MKSIKKKHIYFGDATFISCSFISFVRGRDVNFSVCANEREYANAERSYELSTDSSKNRGRTFSMCIDEEPCIVVVKDRIEYLFTVAVAIFVIIFIFFIHY